MSRNQRLLSSGLAAVGFVLVSSCSPTLVGGKTSKVEDGFLGLGVVSKIELEDNASEKLPWKTASLGLVRGRVLSPNITGTCTGAVTKVEIRNGGSLLSTVNCQSGRFSISLSGGLSLSNGTHLLTFDSIPVTTSLSRTYELNQQDPATLITLDSVSASTVLSSISYEYVCQADLTVVFNSVSATCLSGQTVARTVSLPSLGTHNFSIAWSDVYNNAGTQAYSIVRNPSGSPLVLAGMVSATQSEPLTLTNCSGACGASAPQLSLHAVTGFTPGTASQAIPLARMPNSGSTDRINLGNHSYIYCKNQNGSGVCIP